MYVGGGGLSGKPAVSTARLLARLSGPRALSCSLVRITHTLLTGTSQQPVATNQNLRSALMFAGRGRHQHDLRHCQHGDRPVGAESCQAPRASRRQELSGAKAGPAGGKGRYATRASKRQGPAGPNSQAPGITSRPVALPVRAPSGLLSCVPPAPGTAVGQPRCQQVTRTRLCRGARACSQLRLTAQPKASHPLLPWFRRADRAALAAPPRKCACSQPRLPRCRCCCAPAAPCCWRSAELPRPAATPYLLLYLLLHPLPRYCLCLLPSAPAAAAARRPAGRQGPLLPPPSSVLSEMSAPTHGTHRQQAYSCCCAARACSARSNCLTFAWTASAAAGCNRCSPLTLPAGCSPLQRSRRARSALAGDSTPYCRRALARTSYSWEASRPARRVLLTLDLLGAWNNGLNACNKLRQWRSRLGGLGG